MNLFHRAKGKDKARCSVEIDISAWVGALAHEIKNPLNTMKLNLQLLQEDWVQPEGVDQAKALKRIKTLSEEVDSLEVILNEFLRLARLSAPDLKPTNIPLLLNEFLDFIEPEAQQAHIEVIREFHDDLPEVDLDSGQIRQALLNIVLNANQSMPDGGQLSVRAYRVNDHMTIDVVDTGAGIRPDRIDKLFDLFYSTKNEGTGLGLPIAQRIINTHGGEIKIKSREGKGSTFSILLPLHQDRISDK